jgi:beta-galactosidase
MAVRVATGANFFTYPSFSTDFRFGQGSGGLYRPVYMHITDKVHVPLNVFSVVKQWGTCVATLSASDAAATVRILTNVQNESAAGVTATLTTKIVDATGTVVLSSDNSHAIDPGTCYVFDQSGTVANPHLWYPNASIYGKPYMYKVYHIIKVGGKTVDVFTSPLGIRTLSWNTDFPLINGKPHYLWGAAGRYDYPALGTAVPAEQQWRDAKILTECGGRYWRPGHSTCSHEFVEACDAYGVMIIQPSGDNEGSFMTENLALGTPAQAVYNKALKSELHRDMIVRDRNNPSIMAWESSNAPIDYTFNSSLRDTVLKWDTLAPRAQSDRGNDKSHMAVDEVISCSLDGCEVGLKNMQPNKPCYGAEGFYTKGTRFEYDNELYFAQVYVTNWKNSKRVKAFGMCQWYMAESPGEDGTGRNFGCSMMDWNRIPKMLYKIYKACWTPFSVKPVVSLAHHWNRSGAVTVNAFSNCPKVRLLINGVSQGERVPYPDTGTGTAMLALQCSWDVTFNAGTLRAEGLDASGAVVCFDEKKTAGTPHHIQLTVEPPLVKPDGETFKITANSSDAGFILATVVDEQGNWCPTASNIIHFTVSGPGNYRGGADQTIGSGGANFHAPGDPELSAEGGMCKVAVKSTFTPGNVTVTATSPGLGQGTASFTVYPVPAPPSVSISSGLMQLLQNRNMEMKLCGKKLLFFVAKPADVCVEVLGINGRILQRVMVPKHSSGWQQLDISRDAQNAISRRANGVCIVRLTADGIVNTSRKLIVVR